MTLSAKNNLPATNVVVYHHMISGRAWVSVSSWRRDMWCDLHTCWWAPGATTVSPFSDQERICSTRPLPRTMARMVIQSIPEKGTITWYSLRVPALVNAGGICNKGWNDTGMGSSWDDVPKIISMKMKTHFITKKLRIGIHRMLLSPVCVINDRASDVRITTRPLASYSWRACGTQYDKTSAKFALHWS